MKNILNKKKVCIIILILLSVMSGRILCYRFVPPILVFITLILVLDVICYNYRVGTGDKNYLMLVVFSAFILRAAVIIAFLMFPNIGISSDALSYEQKGIRIAESWLSGNILYIEGSGTSGKLQFLYYVYNAICFLLFGFNPLIIKILNAFFGVLAGIFLFDLSGRLFGVKAAKVNLILYCFFPSIVYWQTLNLKEAIIVLLLVLAVKSLVSFSYDKKLIDIVNVSVCGTLLSLLRIYLGVLIFFILITVFLLFSKARVRTKLVITVIFLVAIGVGTLVQGYGVFGIELFNIYNLESLNNTRKIAYAGGSQVLTDYNTSTLMGLLQFIPVSTLYFWFAPFIWQWNKLTNIFVKIASVENLVFMLFTVFTVIPGIITCIKRKTIAGILILASIVSLSMMYIISYGNMGLGIRMRDQLIPLMTVFSSAGFCKVKAVLQFKCQIKKV